MQWDRQDGGMQGPTEPFSCFFHAREVNRRSFKPSFDKERCFGVPPSAGGCREPSRNKHVSALRASFPHACALRLPSELHGKNSPAQQDLILTALSSEGASVAHTPPTAILFTYKTY